MPIQHDFEEWLRLELPWRLKVSKSKQVAMESIFYGFADYADALCEKAPDEFEQFFNALRGAVDKISKWRCPKGQIISAAFYPDEEGMHKICQYPNGRTVYKLYPKESEK